jgi:hypothetical protein
MKAPHRGTRRCGSAKVEPKIESRLDNPWPYQQPGERSLVKDKCENVGNSLGSGRDL